MKVDYWTSEVINMECIGVEWSPYCNKATTWSLFGIWQHPPLCSRYGAAITPVTDRSLLPQLPLVGDVLLSGVICTGAEDYLSQCAHGVFGEPSDACRSHDYDVYLSCVAGKAIFNHRLPNAYNPRMDRIIHYLSLSSTQYYNSSCSGSIYINRSIL